MANRAYLYPCAAATVDRLPQERYYDSRHTIPIGWFFFFWPTDIVLVNVRDWQKVILVAPKRPAVERFRSRRSLLQPYLQGERLHNAAEKIAADLSRWPGPLLVMDPSEIVDGDDLAYRSRFEDTVRAIASQAPPEQIDAALGQYCGPLSSDPDTRECQVLGWTYAWDV